MKALLLAVALSAEPAGTPPPPLAQVLSVARPEGSNGDTVDYLLSEKGKPVLYVRFTVVVEPGDAGDLRWLELTVPQGAMGLRTEWMNDKPSRFLMMMGPDVFEIPPPADLTGARPLQVPQGSSKGTDTVVKVPAGTFKVVRFERKPPNAPKIVIYATGDVPVFRIVKAELANNRELTLLSMGHDGTSAFPKDAVIRPFPYGRGGPAEELVRRLLGPLAPSLSPDGGFLDLLKAANLDDARPRESPPSEASKPSAGSSSEPPRSK